MRMGYRPKKRTAAKPRQGLGCGPFALSLRQAATRLARYYALGSFSGMNTMFIGRFEPSAVRKLISTVSA